eukprot:scaffold10581_cov117-Isochrysis_galbana.AAC.2
MSPKCLCRLCVFLRARRARCQEPQRGAKWGSRGNARTTDRLKVKVMTDVRCVYLPGHLVSVMLTGAAWQCVEHEATLRLLRLRRARERTRHCLTLTLD